MQTWALVFVWNFWKICIILRFEFIVADNLRGSNSARMNRTIGQLLWQRQRGRGKFNCGGDKSETGVRFSMNLFLIRFVIFIHRLMKFLKDNCQFMNIVQIQMLHSNFDKLFRIRIEENFANNKVEKKRKGPLSFKLISNVWKRKWKE